jgi:heme/copper-type cytochrome/quinol oxidase subunit 3
MSEIIVSRPAAPISKEKAKREQENNLKFAYWLYLASEVVIFGVMIAAFAVFRFDHAEEVHHVHEAVGVALVTANTFLLLASSWAMVMGLYNIQKGNTQGLIRWIGVTAVLGAIFVGGQYIEYSELGHIGVLMQDGAPYRLFADHFYPPTFFHGLHVVVGVFWALHIIRRARAGAYSPNNYLGVELFGLYWHFVDVVWIVLFTVIYLI